VVAISVIGFLLIPHWSAVLFVTPLIMVLYVDLLGTLQFSGLKINPLTYVCLVVSIGLLVDFLMHIILRYYESTETTREGKVKDTLKTMGASILVGGLSTCLGVIPLAFSTSGIMKTVFTSFVSMVTLGVGHGLILMPVLLSYFGPLVCVHMHHEDLVQQLNIHESGATVESSGANQTKSSTEDSDDQNEDVRPPRNPTCSSASPCIRPPLLTTLPSVDSSEYSSDVQLLDLESSAEKTILAFMEDVRSAQPAQPHDHSAEDALSLDSLAAQQDGNGAENALRPDPPAVCCTTDKALQEEKESCSAADEALQLEKESCCATDEALQEEKDRASCYTTDEVLQDEKDPTASYGTAEVLKEEKDPASYCTTDEVLEEGKNVTTTCCTTGEASPEEKDPTTTCCNTDEVVQEEEEIDPTTTCCNTNEALQEEEVIDPTTTCCNTVEAVQEEEVIDPTTTCCITDEVLQEEEVIDPTTTCCNTDEALQEE
jgi:hypothetical protein